MNLVTKESKDVHASRLRPFLYDPLTTDPAEVALHDCEEFTVEEILEHHGTPRKKSEMTFLVKWAGYDESRNSWEPWENMRLTAPLHSYLRAQGMASIIPKNLDAEPIGRTGLRSQQYR